MIDVDMGIGRVRAGFDDIRRHATIWIGEAPPEEPRPSRPLKGCPSEAQYRRHLKAGEKCTRCRDFMNGVERDRRRKRGGR